MRMPYPYNSSENKIQAERFFEKSAVNFSLFPLATIFNPGEIDILNIFADRIASESSKFTAEALEKIADNHYREYTRISHGEICNMSNFKNGLNLQSVSIWADGSWAMVYQSETGILSNNVVCVSFPIDRPSFTSLIGK